MMLDPNPEVTRFLESVPLLTGVFLDPAAGPVAASRPAAVLHQSSTDKIRMIDNSVTEDLYSETELEAHYAGLGWPSLNKLPSRPWNAPTTMRGSQHKLQNETWALRRFMVQRATINLSLQDIRPVEPLVEAFETALGQETYDLQIQALQEVFRIWGEFIPLNAVAGAFMGVTGILNNGTSFPSAVSTSNSNAENQLYSLTEIVDRQLGTSGCFGRRLETRVQGGSSQALLTQGCSAWLRSIDGRRPISGLLPAIHQRT
ncbi:hypothetical protein B0J17DRAFT_154066 [Rhizoctonia solani]|nr:hypothetical protein B0J17DRAFT_154066 [Rhizoctonia solani]